MELEEFFSQLPDPRSAAFTSLECTHDSLLPDEVRQAANRGLRIFPAGQVAKLTGNSDLLIGEATCDISRLEELTVAAYPLCEWRIAIGPSSLCVLHLDGPVGRNSFAALIQEHGEDLSTLQAHRGDTAWAFFRWPKGLVLRATAKRLAPGVRVLAGMDSCILVPFSNPWAETEAVPSWLQELAFEAPDNSPGKAAPMPPAPSPRPIPCRRPAPHFVKPRRDRQKGYPICGQAAWRRGGFRIPQRR